MPHRSHITPTPTPTLSSSPSSNEVNRLPLEILHVFENAEDNMLPEHEGDSISVTSDTSSINTKSIPSESIKQNTEREVQENKILERTNVKPHHYAKIRFILGHGMDNQQADRALVEIRRILTSE